MLFLSLAGGLFVINQFVTKGHPFYVQKRLGKHKKEFGLIKFRSMRVDASEVAPSDIDEKTQKNMETGFGRFFRRTSLDETP